MLTTAVIICTDEGDKSQIHFLAQTTLISTAMEGVREGKTTAWHSRAQELCESPGGRPGLPVPNKHDGLCGRKATLNRLQSSGAV